MNKFITTVISEYLKEIKNFKEYTNLDKIKDILNNEIPSRKCISVAINDSSKADSFYGLIVYPKVTLNKNKELDIESYAVEIQKQLLDILEPEELMAMLLHDISHNILYNTVIERMKMAIYKSAKMSNMRMAEIVYNIDNRIRNLIILDISNRTYKERVIPDLEMYEPDRILVDLNICAYFNSAIEKIRKEIDIDDMSNPDHQDTYDVYIGTKAIKMVREKAKGIEITYNQMSNYINDRYDTKVFNIYPSIEVKVDDEKYGEKVSDIETLKPYELSMLQENAIFHITNKQSYASTLLESVFKQNRPSISAMEKELNIINFKIEAIGSNYERLSILDRIYDNIFVIEKYLEQNPDDESINSYLKKFNELTSVLKDAKIAKRKYGVFVEYPQNYEG